MDNADEQAEALLPCCGFEACTTGDLSDEHVIACPAAYRDAVAAALREKDEIIKEQHERIREYLRRLG